MTVRELIEMLEEIPDDVQVIVSKDSEGNAYSPMSKQPMYPAKYIPETTWYGEVVEYSEEPEAVDAIVLYPIN